MNISEEIEENKDVLFIPPLLIQPIIENSFKHELFHKVRVCRLYSNYDLIDNALVITIQDNGIGRNAAAQKMLKNREKYVSSGINTTKERLDILSFGKGGTASAIVIDDLVDKNNSSLGTKTVIRLSMD
ncbi:MAG: sensor histidine kinase YesM [Halioglobus sp.]